ncbi:MAG: hypothetical protein GY811_08080 [Myxococcales bacterium]|nr:hypothetical protein [Myxococcales bacterium]
MRAPAALLVAAALVACGSHGKAQSKALPADVEIFWPDAAALDTRTLGTAAVDGSPALEPTAATSTPESGGNAEVAK